MFDRDTEPDAASAWLERRWFAAMTAARGRQAQCEALRVLAERSVDAWRSACKDLDRLESLRDALGEELAERDNRWAHPVPASIVRLVSSAA